MPLSMPCEGENLSVQSGLISMSIEEFYLKNRNIFELKNITKIYWKRTNHALLGRHFLWH